MKRCARCSEWKPTDSYTKNRQRVDGLHAYCKQCIHTYYEANKEACKTRSAASQTRRAAELKEYHRNYYQAHKEQWRKRNSMPERKQYMRDYLVGYYERKQSTLRALARQHYRENPAAYKAYAVVRRSREKGVPGRFTSRDIEAMIIAQKGLCYYCGTLLDRFDIDHKIPLIRRDLGSTNWPENLCCSCARCNNQKRTKTADEYIAYRRARGLPINQVRITRRARITRRPMTRAA